MKRTALSYLGIIIGALFISIGLYFFWMPFDLAAGGISGLSIVIKAIIPAIPIGIIIFCLDILMFFIGFLVLGKNFGIRSVVCSLTVSFFMIVLEFLWPNVGIVSEDTLIILLFGALFIAIGQAIVFNLEASSGGTDIVAKIINKYTHLNIGVSLMIADLVVVLFATTIFGVEKGLYAALGVLVTSSLIDYIIAGFTVQKYVMIVPSSSEKSEVIKSYILNNLDRGATVYQAEGGYSKHHKMVLTTVMDRKQFIDLKKYVGGVDSRAFMTVQNLHEVVGEGFEK
ncbi:YitT family protein [Cellulosilyticum ruminicola]|uniref:YitT family protein n=1 Tax=Cellulosilyticum ruminicola TaxID=425254 RepID=UPI0006D1451E|nr:YitT family protein [Cellulosilyticum ruminicola]